MTLPVGHDKGLEAVGTQIVEQFEHRMKDHIRVEAARFRMFCRVKPIFYNLRKNLLRRAKEYQEKCLQFL